VLYCEVSLSFHLIIGYCFTIDDITISIRYLTIESEIYISIREDKLKKKFIIIALVLALMLTAVVPLSVVWSAETGDVSCTVTAQFVSLSVSDGNVNYGSLALDTIKDTTNSGVNHPQIATNNGNLPVNLYIKSSNAIGGTTPWTIGTSKGANQFTHSCTTNGNDWLSLSNAYISLASGIAPNGTQTFHLRIGMPTSVSDGSQKTITVTVQAVANQ
jgi:hypothetical protein